MSFKPTAKRADIAISDPPFAPVRARVPRSEVDRAVATLAHRQSGVVSRQQLLDLGLSSEVVSRRLTRGTLHRLVDGVYLVGHPRVSREGLWAAALLFAGPAACLSHRTALSLWGIENDAGRVEVIRDFNRSNPRKANTRDRWLAVHRTRSLPQQDLARHRGFPVTTVARTLLDVTPRLNGTQIRKFLAAADRKGLADRGEFHSILERRAGCTGIGRLREAVAEWDPLAALTKSDVESWFLRLRTKYGIPDPEVNVQIGDYEVDCFWREKRVIVELDTYTYHGDPFAFETDHDRDLVLKGMKFDLLRITAAMLQKKEAMVMNTLRDLLGESFSTGNEISR